MTGDTSSMIGISAVAFVTGWLLVASLVWSIRDPASSVWPLPHEAGPRLRERRLVNRVIGVGAGLTIIATVCIAFVSRAPVPEWQMGLGAIVFFAGGAVGLAGYFSLGAAASTGEAVPLVSSGMYRYTRNPQYLGAVGGLVGAVIASGSALAALVAAPAVVWFLLAPLAEEAALRRSLGAPYDTYLESAPRYLGLPRSGRPHR